MNTVFAPVDFSDASINALSFAAELSIRASARLVVISVLEKDEDEELAKRKLMLIESDLKNNLGAGLKWEAVLATGKFMATLIKLIKVQQPDLVVMGTKGASGIKRILVGSNTVKVIAKTKVPVLVIPELARFEDFLRKGKNRVVLATDLEVLENEQTLGILKEISMLILSPKIRVLSVREKNSELSDLKKIERDFLLSFFNPEIESERVTIFSNDVISGINFYLNDNFDCGLLAMIARDSGTLIQKHYTREMAARTELPLLILHDAKIS